MIDLDNNVIPDTVTTIHLIAVCGTGMGALACVLKDMNYQITGSDQKIYPPISTFLKKNGIKIKSGFYPENLAYHPDLVIVGNAVTKDNPEVKAMCDMGLFYCSMPQAVNHFLAAGKKTILVTGTHGKTTTASILAWILFQAGVDPSFIIGGILRNFNSNYRMGTGDYIVIEGDEYDTAFFDKGPKFIHYDPFIAILTSVEYDHADIFQDLGQVTSVFDRFIDGVSPENTLLAYDNDPVVSALTRRRKCGVIKYGVGNTTPWQLGNVTVKPPYTLFEVLKNGRPYKTFKTFLQGRHNLYNTLACISAADQIHIPPQVIKRALATFKGTKRRQEVSGIKNGITVIDDFAHHPTAVRETIAAVKPFYPHGRLIAVFEPRTHSSMRKVFQDVYPGSFRHADIVCIRQPSLLDKVPLNDRFSSKKLVDDLIALGKEAHYFPNTGSIIGFLTKTARKNDVILIMSNGGFDNIHERLLDEL